MTTRTTLRPRRRLVSLVLIAIVTFCGCSRSHRTGEAGYLEAGKKQLASRDYARAILEFKNAVRAAPQDPEPYYQLALASEGLGDLGMEVNSLRKCIELNPKHAGAQLRLAELMVSTNDPGFLGQAEKHALDVLNFSPNNVEALNTLAEAELRLGKQQDAEGHLQTALEKVPQNLRSSASLAKAKVARKDFAGAEEVLKNAAAQSPPSVEAMLVLGSFYLSTNKSAEAEQQFARAVQTDPKNGEALLALASTQYRAGKKEQADESYKRIATLPNKEYRPLHALFLFRSGRQAEAISEFERLNKTDPADRRLRSFLVSAYVSTNRPAEAEKVLDAAVHKNPKDADALLQRGALYSVRGKDTEALSDLTQAQAMQRDSAQALYLLAQIYGRRGQPLRQRQELSDALKSNPSFLRARIELARLLIAEKAAKAALELLDAASPDQKNTVEVIVQRNWALYSLGDLSELRKGIDRGLALATVPDLLLQDAMLKFKQKQYASAREELEEVLRKNPEEVRAFQLLVTIYLAQKQPAMALEKAREYASGRPQSAPLQFYFGQLLQNTGNLAEARRAYDAAKAASPNLEGADLGLALLDLWEHKLDDARKRLTALLSVHNNTTARYLLGQVEEAAGNFPAAIDAYQRTVDAEPDNVVALNNLAYALVQYGNQADQALKYAQKAQELAPDMPLVEGTLGWVLYRKGMYNLAVPYLERATHKKAQAGGKAVDHYHLAMAYFQSGDHQRGRLTLQTALQMDPSLPEAKMAQQLLEK